MSRKVRVRGSRIIWLEEDGGVRGGRGQHETASAVPDNQSGSELVSCNGRK